MTTILELLAGVVGAVALVVVARRSPRGELPVYAAGLVVASLFYVLFALVRGSLGDVGLEAMGLLGFALVAVVGWRGFALVLGAAWLLHVAWDVALHPAGSGGYAPGWYPVVCVGFDLFLAVYIFARRPPEEGRTGRGSRSDRPGSSGSP